MLYLLASQVALVVKNLPANVGVIRTTSWIPGLERSPGVGIATHSSILAWKIPHRGAWRATVHRVPKSWTGLKQLSMNTCPVYSYHKIVGLFSVLHNVSL